MTQKTCGSCKWFKKGVVRNYGDCLHPIPDSLAAYDFSSNSVDITKDTMTTNCLGCPCHTEPEPFCEWVEREDSPIVEYITTCENLIPLTNAHDVTHYKYCPYCSKKITVEELNKLVEEK